MRKNDPTDVSAWRLMLMGPPLLLLHPPDDDQGSRDRSTKRRLTALRAGDYVSALAELRAAVDRSDSKRRERRRRPWDWANGTDESLRATTPSPGGSPTASKRGRRAINLVRHGGLSRAAAVLASEAGPATTANAADIREQLASKQEQCKEPLPAGSDDAPRHLPPGVLEYGLVQNQAHVLHALRNAPKLSACGPTGNLIEHYLLGDLEDHVEGFQCMANALASGQVPNEITQVMRSARLVPTNKRPRTSGPSLSEMLSHDFWGASAACPSLTNPGKPLPRSNTRSPSNRGRR